MSFENGEAYLKLMNSDISSLHGVGAKRAQAFNKMGVYTISDLLNHFPRAYQNRGNVRKLTEGIYGENCSYMLTVGSAPHSVTLKNRKVITKFRAFDESGVVEIIYFNSRYVENTFKVGQTYRFWGKLNRVKGHLSMSAPIHEFCLNESELPDFTPVYPLGSGLTQSFVSEAITSAIIKLSSIGAPEFLPEALRAELSLPKRATAFRMIHRPKNMAEIEISRKYFSVYEMYIFCLSVALNKGRKKLGTPPKMTKTDMSALVSSFPFPLTNAQKRSVNEIYSDMVNAKAPMTRLLSGDVGSGKTAVAAAALHISVSNGYQAALMAPTEILASQHANTLCGIFEQLGYSAALILGSTPLSQKKLIKQGIKEGKIDLIIGTHSLISEDVVFNKLGLVITDEQHRFGVSQRAGLGKSNICGCDPHVLVMSATPIPRTLALILYGELELSMLDELPKGRQRVDTFVVGESYRQRLNAFIEKQVKDGGQVYIVCPAVESKNEDENGDLISFNADGIPEMEFDRIPLKNAVEHYAYLSDTFPHLSVGLIHGRMKGKEKEQVMRDFSLGKIQILVSTTVIEVGVDVPNSSLMIIENAERFGLSQLHQLRGRVGRGSRKAYCVLVSETGTENAKKRLDVMRTTYDGYKIAEHDLSIRGPGDYFPSKNGTARQHGNFSTVMNADMPTLKKVMSEAEKTVQTDPSLENGDNIFAKYEMKNKFFAEQRAMQ